MSIANFAAPHKVHRYWVVAARAPHFLRRTIKHASGWRACVMLFAAGGLSALSMAPFYLSPVLFLTLPVLFWSFERTGFEHARGWRKMRAIALAGWWFGFGYHFAGLYWIGHAFLVEADRFAWLMPFAITIMPAGLAIFFALSGWVFALLTSRTDCRFGRLLAFVFAVTFTEWLRGIVLTGFPWNTLGYALTAPLPFMQLAAILGIYGLTALVVFVFTSPFVLLATPARYNRSVHSGQSRQVWLTIRGDVIFASMLPLALSFVYGIWALSSAPVRFHDGPIVRLVQPSVPQSDKFLPEKRRAILDAHLKLTRRSGSGAGGNHTLVIWPEAAMPFLALREPIALSDIAEALPKGTTLLAGTLRLGAPQRDSAGRLRVYNSTIQVDDEGRVRSVYDKVHLVPFGEYLPFQDTLEAMGLEQLTRVRGGFQRGIEPRPLMAVPGLPPVELLICYEAMFPAEIARGTSRPGLLINLTNDAWFGRSTGPYQHFHQVRVRSVEQGLTLIRSANNGISAVIGPAGRVVTSLGLDVTGSVDSRVPVSAPPTLFATYGKAIERLLLAVLLIGALALRLGRGRGSS